MNLILAPDVSIFSYPTGGVIYCRNKRKEYTVGLDELYIIEEACKTTEHFEKNTCSKLPCQKVKLIVEQYKSLGIIIDKDEPIPIKSRLFLGIKFIKNNIIYKQKNDKFRLYQFMSRFILLSLFVLFPAVILLFLSERFFSDFFAKISENIHTLDIVLYLLLFSFFPTLGHEISHAISAKCYGCYVVEAGVTLRVIFICFYVRIVGMGMCKREEKIHIFLSGMLFNFLIAFVSFLIAKFLKSQMFLYNIFMINAISNIGMVLENSICFFRFDGNLVLKELMNHCSFLKSLQYFTLKERTEIIFFISIQSIAMIFSLFFKLPILPAFFHSIIIISILKIFEKAKCSSVYCLFVAGYACIVGVILFIYMLYMNLPNKLLNIIVFFLIINFCLVWIGSFVYFVSHYLLMKKYAKEDL